jgi:fatty acid desaturase
MADPRVAGHEVILEGVVYDLAAFAKVHPGGGNILNIFGGSDATTHYYMLHQHSRVKTSALAPFRLREAGPPAGQTAAQGHSVFLTNSEAFQELKQAVRAGIPNQWATAEWYVKAVCIMLGNLYLEYLIYTQGPSLMVNACLGFMMALVGLAIQHDANHGAVSPTGWVNQLFGYTQDWIGGSALLWRHHHVLMHHAETNVDGDDPDITGDLIRFHDLTNWKGCHKYQAIYTWVLLPLLPINWHFKEFFDLVKMEHLGRPISPMARGDRNIALLLRVAFFLRFYVGPLYLYPSLHTLACIAVCLAVGGGYLGLNFIISHNFEGVKTVLKDSDRSKHAKKDWAVEQVETSSTVGGRALGFLHGGLNYQIEHHLFPRISHVHYHKLAPIVKQWCKEHKVKYSYYPTLYSNVESCVKYLHKLGHQPQLQVG